MRNIFIFTLIILLVNSCSTEEDAPTPTPDIPETFGAWTPDFTDQTSDFSQSSTGNKGTVKTRNITVTSSSVTEEDNERSITFNLDLNSDGDFVDYVERTITTYTASEGLGSFTIESEWTVSLNQDSNFGSLNYGNWGTTVTDDGVYLYDYLLILVDSVAESSSGVRDNPEDCFGMETLQQRIDEIPYLDYDILEDTDTNVAVAMYDIDLGEYIGDEEYNGIYIDYIFDWSTEDVAGNDSITVFEAIYLAFSDYGVYDDSTLVTSLTGELGRLSDEELADLGWTICSENTGKRFNSGKTTIEYLLNNIKNKNIDLKKVR